MSKKNRSTAVFAKKSSIVATEVALALMAAQFAYAQQPVQTAERVERVEITGTRLPALNVEGSSPITVLNEQEIRMDGLQKAEDLLNNLPQVTAAQGSYASNGAVGTAQVNLRGLGPTRNLVLVNGRRLPPGSPDTGSTSNYAADLNQIPIPLVQRIENLTGGASAVYGSDAMSGVVNFIMNDRFEGLQFDVNHSFYNHQQQENHISDIVRARSLTNPSQFQVPGDIGSDGKVRGLSMLMGRNFADNRGNATLFFNYRKDDAVLQSSRDFSACALGPNHGPNVDQTPLSTATDFVCAGSSTSATGRFILTGADGPGSNGSRTIADAAGNTRAFNRNTDQFNFNPFNYFRRPAEQYGFNAFAHLDVAPSVRAYTELGFHDNHTDAQIAPSGIFLGSVTTPVDFANPFLSADWKTRLAAANAVCAANPATCDVATAGGPFVAPGNKSLVVIGRRNVEGGGRDDDIRHSSYRVVFGLKGDVAKKWNYDVFFQTGKVLYQETYLNDFSKSRLAKALDVVPNTATGGSPRVAAGQPVCRSELTTTGVADDANCRPYNIWQLGGVTPDALAYLQTPGFKSGYTQQHVANLTVSSDLGTYGVKLPSARTGVGVVLGGERRKETLVLNTDAEFSTFDLAGQGGPTIGARGSLVSDELFGEVRVPLIEKAPFADLLSVSGSARHSAYSDNKNTNTYGLGAEWAPVRAYRLRGSYQRAVRHANIVELFQGTGNNLFDMASDPCGGSPSATAAQCARTGVTTNYGNPLLDSPAGQFNYRQGGNANLKPETANTWTLGLVFNPAKNVTGTIDWWSIKIDDTINPPPPASVLSACLNDGLQCNKIHRDSQQTLWLFSNGGIDSFTDNLGSYKATGVDVALSWTQRMGGMGGFGLNFIGSYMAKWELEPFKGGAKFDCAGFFGSQCGYASGSPLPKWRHKMRASWSTPWNVDLALTWRHIDKVKNELTSSDQALSGDVAPMDRELGARDYFDLAGSWVINKTFGLRVGVNNIFDKDPPLVTNGTAGPSIFGNGNTFPQTYDTLGRFVFMNLVAKF
jgi:outer membrane receptor protein involved in Fe transport